MRIDTGVAYLSFTKRKSADPAPYSFESALKKSEDEKKKQEEKKGRLITAREGAYVRQYLVNSDGSKVLLSESKQPAEDSSVTGNDQHPASRLHESGMSHNTQEILNLLNLQTGTSIPK